MKAIIQAAGVGSRLNPITNDRPKCMVKVGNTSMVDNAIDSLIEANIKDITVITGYMGEMLKDYLSNKYPFVKVINNYDYDSTNNMYSLRMALDTIDSKILFMNSDLYYDKEMMNEFIKSAKKTSIACLKGDWNDENMKITYDKKITSISKLTTEKDAYGVSCDMYIFEKEDALILKDKIDELLSKNKKDWTELAIDAILNDIDAQPVDLSKYKWYEIDNIEDLENATDIFYGDIKDYDSYIFDMDGTLYTDGKAIDSSVKFFNKLVKDNKNISVITNNSFKLPEEYKKRLTDLGYIMDNVKVSSSLVTTLEALTTDYKNKPVFVVGTKEVKQFLKENGVNVVEKDSDVCLVTNDQTVDWEKLKNVSFEVQKGATLISTNIDLCYPMQDNLYAPDCGSITKLIELTCNKKSKYYGKPSVEIIKSSIKGKTILVGDRLHTDIMCAKNANIDSCFVLTGHNDLVDLNNSDIKPTNICKELR